MFFQSKTVLVSSPQNKKNYQKQSKSKTLETSVYPCSCVGLIIAHFDEHINYASGSLIGKNLILTAASNIYRREEH